MPTPSTVWITTNWKILQEMGISDHLTCLLINLHAGQEAIVRIRCKTADCFQIWKGVCQGWILSPCLFNLNAGYIMWNAGLDEAQAGIKIARRSINNFRYADGTTLTAESEEELKNFLMKVRENSEKADLKVKYSKNKNHGIWSHHFLANRWRNHGNSDRLYFLGFQNHCRWWLQPWN